MSEVLASLPASWTQCLEAHQRYIVCICYYGTRQLTSQAFFDVVEWAAEQPWSSGKVGLLGISYYAGSQWRVAARKPKGLAAMIPWEGMSDYYRDRCRQ